MNIFSQFAKGKDAVTLDYGTNEDGSPISFTVARMNRFNKKYVKALERITKPYRRQLELETLDEKLAESLFIEVFAESILIDWNGVQDEEGKTIAYSKQNAAKLLELLPELYDDLKDKATRAGTFREEAAEEDVKN